MWGVTDAHDIREHTLDILRVIKPKPSNPIIIIDYLIIGTGKYTVEFDESFYKHFRELKMVVDILPTVTHFI
jgi:NADH dehydrogenase [ubiquinone] 1 alpha subcomplex assembly factor 3